MSLRGLLHKEKKKNVGALAVTSPKGSRRKASYSLRNQAIKDIMGRHTEVSNIE